MSNENLRSIPSFVTSPQVTSSVIPIEQPKQKPHYTKAEKRANNRQQKAATRIPPNARQPSRKSRHTDQQDRLGDYSNLTIEQIDDQIHLLSELRRLKTKTGLESRVTRNEPASIKKELSPKKLEKIQKRREMRAAKKAAWLAKKAAEGDSGQTAGPEASANNAPVQSASAKTAAELDNINWDEL